MSFSDRLKTLREQRGISQERLAEILGIPRSSIAHYESPENDRLPRPERLKKIADFFGVTTDYLIGRTNDPHGHAIVNFADSEPIVTAEERRLLETVRELPPEKKQELMDFADFLRSRTVENSRKEQIATIEYDEEPFTSLGFPRDFLEYVPLEERPEFIAWLTDEFQGMAFFDFDEHNSIEHLQSVMNSILMLWKEKKDHRTGSK